MAHNYILLVLCIDQNSLNYQYTERATLPCRPYKSQPLGTTTDTTTISSKTESAKNSKTFQLFRFLNICSDPDLGGSYIFESVTSMVWCFLKF